jgi:eukaryotic-like serine/threonine-protein kinase
VRLEDRVRLPSRYRLTGFIAGGGMAGVWEAEDTRLDRRVAVKVLADHLAEDPVNARRFQREARAAARVSSHPHVVTIYDVGEHEGRSFIVMERLNGGTVADALRHGRIPADRALTWLRDAASALDVAHEHGIVHRDVKPGNLLLDDADRVRVADFGIARLTTDDTVTTAGQLLGTAAYLSPEQIVGRPTTPASDRYSLAVVAYELLTGRRPFRAEHPTAQARQHLEEDAEPPTHVDPRLPKAVDAVLARGLAKEPADRWPTATAFVDALAAALAADGDTTRRMAAPVFAGGARRRRSWPALAALVVVAAAVALVVGLSSGGGKSGHSLRQAAVTHKSKATHKRAATKHHRTKKPAANTNTGTTTPSTGTTTPSAGTTPAPSNSVAGPSNAAAPQGNSIAALNSRQVDAYKLIKSGRAAEGLAMDRAILSALGAQGYSVARCKQPASDQGCMVFAHALFDVGHALRVLGQPAAAVPYLQRRLLINDQLGVVQQELARAMREAGGAAAQPGTGSKGPKKHGHD